MLIHNASSDRSGAQDVFVSVGLRQYEPLNAHNSLSDTTYIPLIVQLFES